MIIALVGVNPLGLIYTPVTPVAVFNTEKKQILDVGNTACVWLANQRYGWDRHIYDIPFDKWAPTAKAAFTAKVLPVSHTCSAELKQIWHRYYSSSPFLQPAFPSSLGLLSLLSACIRRYPLPLAFYLHPLVIQEQLQ